MPGFRVAFERCVPDSDDEVGELGQDQATLDTR